ncbi:MAG: RNHCP domain-containing protein [Anaerolineales bacterium]|nr:RNHCP domain-containing protein [Anaerolineales bacterium]
MNYHASSFGDFRCGHCGQYVTTAHVLSGVNNRNHCPYCLWSRHLDLYSAGDRLSACKGQMKPIGLTMKKSRNKYQIKSRGELMLIHECVECGDLSINRIAADDDPDSVMEAFLSSQSLSFQTNARCEVQGIVLLNETAVVQAQLFGEVVPA